MGLFDRFKSDKAPTQKASSAAQVKKETAPTKQELTAKEWYDKGAALFLQIRNQEAIECFDKALAIDRQYHVAWRGKAAALMQLGRREESMRCLRRG